MKAATLLLGLASASFAADLPVVDLGYELHRAFSLNHTTGQYNFSNIRYAAPPLGDLRFRAPVAPEKNRSHVQTGDVGRMCPQATPLWETAIEPSFLLSLLYNTTFTKSTNISSYNYTAEKIDPRVTEDCLFLDVVVPQKIFDRARSYTNSTKNKSFIPKNKLAPVLVWIYGGGYVGGDKSGQDPTGLITRSQVVGEGVVYVALNYRLGAFGWLGGESIKANGTANAALHDQRFALDWVYKNIHLFGGDPTRVTVMGESAGGGSIMHQITAYGGNAGPSPFKQAILQSPGWVPIPDERQPEQTLQQFLDVLNVSTIDEARKLPSSKLIAANAYQVATKSQWGSFIYGPVVDGTFVPELPGKLLKEGNFDHNLNIMVGHNADEGLVFTSPDSRDENGLTMQLKQQFPYMKKNVSDYVANTLYPPKYDGSYGYTTPLARAALVISDLVFVCNTDYFNRAYENQTYAYEFSVPPAIHGQDVGYTFFNKGEQSGNSLLGKQNSTVAEVMQDYFTSFAQSGKPRSPLGPGFHQYGEKGTLVDLSTTKIARERDPTNNPRCRFWQTANFAGEA
ncbi:hypothetical protein PDE_08082 [Penicillium oxalicum 114-2]|uniref:Carboxylic ester hydrolase n=1 Tax=Penicillium oxalicum (strain 114-2 / CGMCC 5302) TaxID=933388 RepID=S7ZQW4_PENO1|nr:hypothetical protein PDE_08082 [Penicillium oxalicum 114-2]